MSAPSDIDRVTIDIWSDVMCPWCLIGWGALSQALETLAGEIEAEVRWRPFELNPDMPAEGEEQAAHIQRKYGRSPEQGADIRSRMRDMAQSAGVSLEYEGDDDRPAMMWNTFDAHKLLAWTLEAHGPHKQTQLKLALFDAHFHHRRRIGDPRVLAEIAAAQGLDRDAAVMAMMSDDWGARVRAEERQAWDANITGVPAMVIDGKFLIPGAQPAESYADALRRVVARRDAA